MKIRDFLFLGLIWHLEGFGSMENTPTGCGSDLPTILKILKKCRKSRSVKRNIQPLDLDPNRIKDFVYQPKLRPVGVSLAEILLLEGSVVYSSVSCVCVIK
jgi:hypothetical protein